MKKITLLAIVVVAATMGSCKKDYTCECKTTDSTDPSFSSTFSYTAKMKKKDAESWCGGYKATAGTISTSCSLK